jgi:hypothetical protein
VVCCLAEHVPERVLEVTLVADGENLRGREWNLETETLLQARPELLREPSRVLAPALDTRVRVVVGQAEDEEPAVPPDSRDRVGVDPTVARAADEHPIVLESPHDVQSERHAGSALAVPGNLGR